MNPKPVEDVRCPHCRKTFNPAVEKQKAERNRLIAIREKNRVAMVAEQAEKAAREAERQAARDAADAVYHEGIAEMAQLVLNCPGRALAKATVVAMKEIRLRNAILAEVARLEAR